MVRAIAQGLSALVLRPVEAAAAFVVLALLALALLFAVAGILVALVLVIPLLILSGRKPRLWHKAAALKTGIAFARGRR